MDSRPDAHPSGLLTQENERFRLKPALHSFTKGHLWLDYEDAEVYVRLSWRYIDGIQVRMLDLANVVRSSRYDNVQFDPSVKSTGFMKRLMEDFESRALEIADGVYVESVMNEFLPDWFVRRGYMLVPDSWPLSFYRLNGDSNACTA